MYDVHCVCPGPHVIALKIQCGRVSTADESTWQLVRAVFSDYPISSNLIEMIDFRWGGVTIFLSLIAIGL